MKRYLLLALFFFFSDASKAELCFSPELPSEQKLALLRTAESTVGHRYEIAEIQTCENQAFVYFEPFEVTESAFRSIELVCNVQVGRDLGRWTCESPTTREYVHVGKLSSALQIPDDMKRNFALEIARMVYSHEDNAVTYCMHPHYLHHPISWIPLLEPGEREGEYEIRSRQCSVGIARKDAGFEVNNVSEYAD